MLVLGVGPDGRAKKFNGGVEKSSKIDVLFGRCMLSKAAKRLAVSQYIEMILSGIMELSRKVTP